MLESARFALYTFAMSAFTVVSFATQEVTPLAKPIRGPIGFRSFAEAFPDLPIPGIVDPTDFPGDERRLRRIGRSRALVEVVRRIAPSRTAPVPADERAFLATVYPWLMSKAWPKPPATPPRLRTAPSGPSADLLAELAVDGPFASYLRAAMGPDGAPTGEYLIDVDWMLDYPVRAGLAAPGGIAYFAVDGQGLQTVGLTRNGSTVPVADWRGRQLEKDALLAGLNEDLTTFRHNLFVHLATMTPFALASSNTLDTDHPIRRLLHHCFHTVLVGNRELATFQLGGRTAFGATIFSHDHTALTQMAAARLQHYDFWDLEPDRQFSTRGTTVTPFAYPYRDNVLELWAVNLAYVRRYLAAYFDDESWQADGQVSAWLDQLDVLLPNGLGSRGTSVEWLARLCATVIHVSTVEHDVLNNLTWDYSTLSWLIPTVAPENGDRMDRRRAFDLIATLIVTWKPYNMLLTADVPSLALDDAARAVMEEWITALSAVQVRMVQRGVQPSLSYPANLNVSISN